MSGPLSEWLGGLGYTVYTEVLSPYGGGPIDMVGLRAGLVIVEMKTSLTSTLIRQASIGQLLSTTVYCAVASRPRHDGIQRCQKLGLGVVSVRDNHVNVICEPGHGRGGRSLVHQYYVQQIKRRLEHMEPGGVGGLPCLEGVGPAQDVERRIAEYRQQHPRATWKQIYQAVPNHYSSYQSMCSAMRMVAERRRYKEKRKARQNGGHNDG